MTFHCLDFEKLHFEQQIRLTKNRNVRKSRKVVSQDLRKGSIKQHNPLFQKTLMAYKLLKSREYFSLLFTFIATVPETELPHGRCSVTFVK